LTAGEKENQQHRSNWRNLTHRSGKRPVRGTAAGLERAKRSLRDKKSRLGLA